MLGNLHPIVVANRAPLVFEPADVYRNTPERLVKGAGGLVTALSSLASSTNALWVAVARDDSDRALAARGDPAELETEDGTSYRVSFVQPHPDAYDLYYNTISNPLLWFIQHYLWDLAREPIVDTATIYAWREGYVRINQMVADRVVAEARAASKPPLVFVQDYQLYCVPGMVRDALGEVRIQHFVHIPWPTPQYWTILPKQIRDGLLRGLLGCDLVGFQTRRDVRNFLLTCEENLGLTVDFRERTVFFEGRTVWVRNYPISVDVTSLLAQAESEEVRAEEARLLSWRPEKLILRVDRTDLSKNIVRGFLAYERMLEDHHELHGDVQFWAYLQPSRQDIDDYRAYLGNVLSVAARVNRKFSRGGWTPIRVEVDDVMARALAGYRQFDVLLVNPIYDGMNLVAKEGVLCNRRNGVLVLSENAGSHEELGDFALSVNPFDIDETAEALYLGLMMDTPQKVARAERIRETVGTADINRWIALQLQDLRELIG
ncbi:MAG TPA: trehalose-6-phosphate synthase [Candidatus Dormibacteraeota bacterium]|jgi:trehalose 6-phosphate synthase|nr:trehalose-6-phosphate synthase [Candidatus Dormibacteraeota bacterium]